MGLERYRGRRDFSHTPEPRGERAATGGRLFVIQEHAARRHHYDFRLELGGVLKSWAVPKGPSLDPAEKRLAVHVEDHPLEYADFEGVIPPKEYGAGSVLVWDRGLWIPESADPDADYRKGHLRFYLQGQKLQGRWSLVRMRTTEAGKENWLLLKTQDEFAATEDVTTTRGGSVLSGRSGAEVAARPERVWHTSGIPAAQQRQPEKRAPLPATLEPQLATLTDTPPAGDQWLHEIKFDGYRILCRIVDGREKLLSRNGKDWTERFHSVAEAVRALPLREGWLDGEVAVLKPDGTSSFAALQSALSEGRQRDLVYFLFDLLYLDGNDLTARPLLERKAALSALLDALKGRVSPLRYCDHVVGHGKEFFQEACGLALEGVMSKRADRPFRPGRGRDWLKIKCLQRQEFVVGGYTEPSGGRAGFGALLLGVYEGDELLYVGRVGTGFNEQSLRDLYHRLRERESDSSPFSRPLPGSKAGIHWVAPTLVVEVAFANWTRERILRQASYQGLREDKEPREVHRERPVPLPAPPPPARPPRVLPATVAGLRLTNPDKVLYPGLGVTKRDLAHYYEGVADVMLRDIAGRPLTLLRCPEGRHDCFFQKHAVGKSVPAEIGRVAIDEKGKPEIYMTVDSPAGLVGLVQMGVLEIHVWGARADRPEVPDRMVFDLDPDEGLAWEAVLEGAGRLRERLTSLGLTGFVRTTGGKGLHIVVPLARRHSWDEVKDFSHAVARDIVRADPAHYTSRLAKRSRGGKIFIDYLRNMRGASAVANYTTRAKPRAPVAIPLRWEELSADIRSDHFNVHNVIDRLQSVGDPWEEFHSVRQSITKSMKRELGIK